MPKIKKIIIFAIFGFVLSASFVFASPGETGETRDLSINLSNFLGFTVVRNLPEYVSRIYNIMIGLAGGFASFMFIVAGFQYVLARGDASKVGQATKRMENTVVALFLIFGAYLILNTINPALLSLKLPEIKTIARSELKFTQLTTEEKAQLGPQSGRFNCNTATTQDEPIPIDQSPERWCENHCTVELTYTAYETRIAESTNTSAGESERRVCCRCSHPREGTTPPTRTSGSENDCLGQVFVSRIPIEERTRICASFSGTDGQCELLPITTRETRSGSITVGGNFCLWRRTPCDTTEDCARVGSVHCWNHGCYQIALENGQLTDHSSACISQTAARPSGGVLAFFYCTRSELHNNEIPMDGYCLNGPTECQSGVCSIHPGTSRNMTQCN